MFVLGCSDSESPSGGGCGSSATQHCEINATATVCGDRITLECFDGATPDAAAQCVLALEQDDEAVYCCTSAAGEPAAEPVGAAGGGGSGGAAT